MYLLMVTATFWNNEEIFAPQRQIFFQVWRFWNWISPNSTFSMSNTSLAWFPWKLQHFSACKIGFHIWHALAKKISQFGNNLEPLIFALASSTSVETNLQNRNFWDVLVPNKKTDRLAHTNCSFQENTLRCFVPQLKNCIRISQSFLLHQCDTQPGTISMKHMSWKCLFYLATKQCPIGSFQTQDSGWHFLTVCCLVQINWRMVMRGLKYFVSIYCQEWLLPWSVWLIWGLSTPEERTRAEREIWQEGSSGSWQFHSQFHMSEKTHNSTKLPNISPLKGVSLVRFPSVSASHGIFLLSN